MPENMAHGQPPADDDDDAAAATSSRGVRHAGGSNVFWLLPALTFIVGVLLGGSVIAATRSGGDKVATPPPTTTQSSALPTPGATPSDATVTVPGPCLALSDEAQSILTEVDKAATAARDLNASRLGDIVRQLQQSRSTLEKQVTACRNAVSSQPSSAPS